MPWSEGHPALQGWQRLVDGGAQAVNRFAETMQGTGQELLARPEVRAAYLEGGH